MAPTTGEPPQRFGSYDTDAVKRANPSVVVVVVAGVRHPGPIGRCGSAMSR